MDNFARFLFELANEPNRAAAEAARRHPATVTRLPLTPEQLNRLATEDHELITEGHWRERRANYHDE